MKIGPLLSINPVISKVFKEKSVVAYRRNDNLRKLIGQNKLAGDKKVVLRTHQKIGRCQPCRSKVGNLCYKQVKNTFSNRITKKVYEIYHDLNCKSRNGIYLLECTKCENKPYVGKFETAGNERINNHRKDAKNPHSIPVDAHFLEPGHDFNIHGKFTFIEQLRKKDLTNMEKTRLLKEREDFWIKKLQTLTPNGFNQELNFK